MKIIIVDDAPIVCESLRMITVLGSEKSSGEKIEVLATGNDGLEAIQLYKKHRPDIILLDIQMSEMNGLDAAKEIIDFDPKAKVLFLTSFLDDEYILQALRLGAKGYLIKSNVSTVLPALYAIQNHQYVFGDDIVEKIPELIGQGGKAKKEDEEMDSYFAELSDKEWSFVELVAQGLNNKEIAEELHFSEGTVRNYLSIILEKLNLRDRTQLAIAYYKYKK